MAVITNPLSTEQIDQFVGVIDFYDWRGIHCARKWPYYGKRKPTPLEHANQQDFAYINRVAISLDPFIIDQFKRMAAGTPFSWKDLVVRAYMKGIPY